MLILSDKNKMQQGQKSEIGHPTTSVKKTYNKSGWEGKKKPKNPASLHVLKLCPKVSK